jgi:hypothetical protein
LRTFSLKENQFFSEFIFSNFKDINAGFRMVRTALVKLRRIEFPFGAQAVDKGGIMNVTIRIQLVDGNV